MAPLYVARPLLPSLDELNVLLAEVWATKWVTNEGPLHNRLESALAERLGVPVARLFSSGTAALQCAMLALDLKPGGEVITTPLTFPATAHAITACGLKPVFADIDPDTLTIDPRAVERAITRHTVAVIGVHVYGTICDDPGLQALCSAHGLWLIYDAAHAFAAEKAGVSSAAMGDLSVFSMHATKLYNTIEGGLITTRDPAMSERLQLARNFGIASEEEVKSVGINGKMSELHAAVGLLNLKTFEQERDTRRRLRGQYDAIISQFPGLIKQAHQRDVLQSEQYYMLRVEPDTFGASRDDIYARLKERNIFSRRYFWPICTDYDSYRGAPVASLQAEPVVERIKTTLLCLPFHSGVEPKHVQIFGEVLEEMAAATFATV